MFQGATAPEHLVLSPPASMGEQVRGAVGTEDERDVGAESCALREGSVVCVCVRV